MMKKQIREQDHNQKKNQKQNTKLRNSNIQGKKFYFLSQEELLQPSLQSHEQAEPIL